MLAKIAVLAAAAPVLAGIGSGQWVAVEEAKLSASDAKALDLLGVSVAVSKGTAVIGALDAEYSGPPGFPGEPGVGAAYVFVEDEMSWREQSKLTASDAAAGDSFGVSVGMYGDTALVGAWLDDHGGAVDAGSAYVFVRDGTTWSEQQKLVASDAEGGDLFGFSAAVCGNTALVGSLEDDHSGVIDTGSAYVFVRGGTTWIEQQKLTASDAGTNDDFGRSVALSGDTALVGAYSDDIAPGWSDIGSAYVFVRSGTTWIEQQKLIASNANGVSSFGHSVSLSGETALVGAYLSSAGAVSSGAAYVYLRNGVSWNEQQKLVASDLAPFDWFGYSVAISDDIAVIGAYSDDHPFNEGSAYLYVRNGETWEEQQKMTASDGVPYDYFGNAVAIDGDMALVGAYGADEPDLSEAGRAYAFQLHAPPMSYCTAGISASGCQAEISASGVASTTATSGFHLASKAEGDKDGAFYMGTHGQQDDVRCLSHFGK